MPTSQRSPQKKRPEQYARIEGLDDFLKDMGVLPANMKRAEQVFETLAGATVVSSAKVLAAGEGSQQVRASQTLKQLGAGVVQYGGLPYAMGAEYGSILYGQFPEWRGNREDAGYFFWPAIREFRDDDMLNLWVREVWTVVEHLFSN